MKKLKLFLLFILLPAFLKAGIYDGVVIDTGTKTAERNLSGLFGVAETADTPSTYRITIDGSDGSVNSEILKSPILRGGTDASDNLTLQSTSNATKGFIFFGSNSVFDEVNKRWGFGLTNPTSLIHIRNSGTGTPFRFQRTDNAYQADIAFTPAGSITPTNVQWNFGLLSNVNYLTYRYFNGSTVVDVLILNNNGLVEVKSELEVQGFYSFENSTELTIASGIVTATKSYHKIDTEGDAATDDLNTINGGSTGRIVIFTSANSARDTTFKHATGNLRLSQGNDFTLDNINATIQLLYDGSNWIEISRSANL